MKAIVHDSYGGPEVLELREVETPVPGEGQVLVRVRAAAANPLDWHFLRGIPYVMRVQFGMRVPKRTNVGNDVAGVVDAVGAGVTRLRPGDEVFGDVLGSFAEYVAAPEDRLAPKPSNLSFEQAAAVPIAGVTALQGLRDHGRVRSGQRVLVIGAGGGVGTFAVQIAKAFGAEVTGVCSTGKVDMVRSIGADRVVDYTREDFMKGRDRYDVVAQWAGALPPTALRGVLTSKGTLILSSGDSSGRVIGPIWHMLGGVMLSPLVSQRIVAFVAKPGTRDLGVLRELIEGGKVTPVIDRTFALEDAPEAIRHLEEGHAAGKIVVTVADS